MSSSRGSLQVRKLTTIAVVGGFVVIIGLILYLDVLGLVMRYCFNFMLHVLVTPTFIIAAIAPILISNALKLASHQHKGKRHRAGSTLQTFAGYKEGVAPYTIVEYTLHYYSTWAAWLSFSMGLMASATYQLDASLPLEKIVQIITGDVVRGGLLAFGTICFVITILFGFINIFGSRDTISSYDGERRLLLNSILLPPTNNAMTWARIIVLLLSAAYVILVKMVYYDIVVLS